MNAIEIHQKLQEAFGDAVGPLSEPKIDPFATVKAERIVEICSWLKKTPGLEMDFLQDLTAIDWTKRDVIEVVYHLYSYPHRHGIVLKAELPRANPVIASLDCVWKAANWLEREVYDLFGVTFTGHPDLRRVMLPDDWVGHPLRKDYQESGGWHGIDNVRENPLVELKRLDDKARAAAAPAAPPPAPPAAPAPSKA